MARRTLAEFDDELVLRLGNRTDIPQAMRARLIHDAYLLVANEFVHPELQGQVGDTIITGADSLTPVANDIWWPTFVKDVTNNRAIDMSSLPHLESREKVSGVIVEYYWWGGVFYFDRLSSADVNIYIWYMKKVEEMGEDDSPVFNAIYDPLITMKAAMHAFESVGNQQQATIQDSAYRKYALDMKFPTAEAEKNDRRKGIKVRYR